MRAGSRKHGLHVAILTPRTSLHIGRPSRVQRYRSSMHGAMEEDSLMTQYEDDRYKMYADVPKSYGEAIASQHALEWENAMKDEIDLCMIMIHGLWYHCLKGKCSWWQMGLQLKA